MGLKSEVVFNKGKYILKLILRNIYYDTFEYKFTSNVMQFLCAQKSSYKMPSAL